MAPDSDVQQAEPIAELIQLRGARAVRGVEAAGVCARRISADVAAPELWLSRRPFRLRLPRPAPEVAVRLLRLPAALPAVSRRKSIARPTPRFATRVRAATEFAGAVKHQARRAKRTGAPVRHPARRSLSRAGGGQK